MKICSQQEETGREIEMMSRMEEMLAQEKVLLEKLEQLIRRLEQQFEKKPSIESEQHSVFITNQQ